MKFEKREAAKGLGVLLPIVAYYAIFTLVPVALLVVYSLTNYNVIKRTDDFIGLRNFLDIFRHPQYFQSIGVTLIIAVFVVVIGMLLGFAIGYLLTRVRRGKSLLRVLWYIPALMPMAAISQWISLLLKPEGTLNQLVEFFGGSMVDWKGSTFWMYFWIIFLVSWKGIGSTALLFIAGLNGVDRCVLEAAEIDGAAGWKKIWNVTLPMIRPMIGFILITGFIGAFNIFEPVLLISAGGPDQSTKVVLYRIYDEAFKSNKLGFSCALSVVVFLIVFVLTLFNMKVSDDSILKA